MPQRVTKSQEEFFDQLLREKQFPPEANLADLAEGFAKLDKRSASLWIDKAMALPKLNDDEGTLVQPEF